MIITYGRYRIYSRCAMDWCSGDVVRYGLEAILYYQGYCTKHLYICRKRKGLTFNSLDDIKAHIAMSEL